MIDVEDLDSLIHRLAHVIHQGDSGNGELGPKNPARGCWGFNVPDARMIAFGKESPKISVGQAWPDKAATAAMCWNLDTQLNADGTASPPIPVGLIVLGFIRGTRQSAAAPERVFVIPPWGICVPLSASSTEFSMQIVNGVSGLNLRPSIGVSYGSPVREFLPQGVPFGIAGAGSVTLAPPTWARRVTITVVSGNLTAPTALAAGASLTLSADTWTLTAGAPAVVDVVWELLSA